MGLILDTSGLVSAERKGVSVSALLASVRSQFGEQDLAISTATIIELVHGVEQARSLDQRIRRRAFVDDVLASLSLYPLTAEIAKRAGEISGQQAAVGVNVPFEDLIIGVTALQLDYAVVTENTRHFGLIPGLRIFRP